MDDPSLKLVAIGLDAIVVVAINADNPLQGISLDELQHALFSRAISQAGLTLGS